jgi:hypothetical protein
MKHSNFFLVAFVTVLLALGGCKKETSTNTQTCTSWFPLKQGNTWTYSGSSPVCCGFYSTTLTCGSDTLIDGITWTSVNVTDTGGAHNTLYFRNSGGDIYALLGDRLDGHGGFGTYLFTYDASYVLQQIIIKENADVGTSWTVSAKTTRTIAEKGLSLTLGSKTFTNVTRVHEVFTDDITTLQFDYYYSKCVGLIKGGPNGYEVSSYTVK